MYIPWTKTFYATGHMFISASFRIVKTGSNPTPIKNRIVALLCIQTKKYNAVIKKNGLQIHMSSWVIFKGITRHLK